MRVYAQAAGLVHATSRATSHHAKGSLAEWHALRTSATCAGSDSARSEKADKEVVVVDAGQKAMATFSGIE